MSVGRYIRSQADSPTASGRGKTHLPCPLSGGCPLHAGVDGPQVSGDSGHLTGMAHGIGVSSAQHPVRGPCILPSKRTLRTTAAYAVSASAYVPGLEDVGVARDGFRQVFHMGRPFSDFQKVVLHTAVEHSQ